MNNCSVDVDAEYEAPVNFSCNLSCISENFIQWYHYKDSITDSGRTLLHNGENIDMNWSSKGITVDSNQTSPPSVLKINEVTAELTGIYECSGQSDPDAGCKIRFCLTAGKYVSRCKGRASFIAIVFLELGRFYGLLETFRLYIEIGHKVIEKGSLSGKESHSFPSAY